MEVPDEKMGRATPPDLGRDLLHISPSSVVPVKAAIHLIGHFESRVAAGPNGEQHDRHSA